LENNYRHPKKGEDEMKATKLVSILLLLVIFWVSPTFSETQVLMMATTTSTDNTGLLDYLKPYFEKDTGVELKWTATGTGKALKLGQNCDVDVLMVHAPASEKKYVADGFGVDRRQIMFNDFVIIGPAADPAGIKGKSVAKALDTIRQKGAVFCSRGDDSGTNKKEISLWESTQKPKPEKETWYVQTGQGMLSTINVTSERGGYTMTDRGTYIKYEANMKGNPPLKILVEGDDILKNQYSVIAINPKNCSKANIKLATVFADWITAKKAQQLIKDFKLLGKGLFTPNAK
jgi:tungstate transport system substrate-binding protein